ncbi:MAG: hypothetical protein JF603_10090 [Acidobacteria bacterium]|nr:hypothetical protein [Acidobacteriota bacterium]
MYLLVASVIAAVLNVVTPAGGAMHDLVVTALFVTTATAMVRAGRSDRRDARADRVHLTTETRVFTDKRLQALTDRLQDSLVGVGTITSSAEIVFDRASYARLYIKPEAELAATILSDRELLVLIADFPDVQMRSIRLAEEQLKASQGRLEVGVTVIVHRDPYGDDKLRHWGRERGLTVLPLNIANSMPRGADLSAALCRGLYTHDPFDLTGPARAAHQFFGRANVPDLARRLRDGHIHALFGFRKIGKTSVLNRILDEARAFHGVACVMLDCSDDSLSSLDAAGLLYAIGGAAGEAASVTDSYATTVPLDGAISASDSGRVLLTQIQNAGRPVLLLIDEFDYITPASAVAPHWRAEFNVFFRALRYVYQECARRGMPFSVVVSGVSSHWFTVDAIDGVENAALAFVPEAYLPPLERPESLEMIKQLGRSAGLVFDDEGASSVAAACSDIPSWIRKAGSFVNSCYAQDGRPVALESADVAQLCGEFVEVEGGHLAYSSLSHLFQIYPELGPAAVTCVLDGKPDRVPPRAISTLGRYGLLDENQAGPSGPMVRAGVQRWREEQARSPERLPLSFPTRPAGAVVAGSVSAAGETEWADLLSEVSHRRNVLERELREFVVAILRAECAKVEGRSPGDLLLTAVPLERRTSLVGKPTATIAKLLFWPELINVIKKNWQWFQACFGDRQQLEMYSAIINDRPDAHAKDFDGADLALQRRALGWMQDRVTTSGVL